MNPVFTTVSLVVCTYARVDGENNRDTVVARWRCKRGMTPSTARVRGPISCVADLASPVQGQMGVHHGRLKISGICSRISLLLLLTADLPRLSELQQLPPEWIFRQLVWARAM